jgi:hypothetical protein
MAGWGIGGWGLGSWGNGETILVGDEATGSVGTASVNVTVTLSGVLAAGVVGTVIVLLRTNTAIGLVGTVGYETAVALSGVSASGAVGTASLGPRSFVLTGNYAQGDIGVVVAVYWKLIDNMQTANWGTISNT